MSPDLSIEEIDSAIAAVISGKIGRGDPEGRRVLEALDSGEESDPIVSRVRERGAAATTALSATERFRSHLDRQRSDEVADLIAVLVRKVRDRLPDAASPGGDSYSLLATILESLFERAAEGRILDDGSLFAALLDVAQRKYRDRNVAPSPVPRQASSLANLRLVMPDDDLPEEVIDDMVEGCQRLLDQAEDDTDYRVRVLALQDRNDGEIAREVGLKEPIIRASRELALRQIPLLFG